MNVEVSLETVYLVEKHNQGINAKLDLPYAGKTGFPILAPKERDLMYAGGGQFGKARLPVEEERLFYRGYGQTPIDPDALAYYGYERIVEDIAVYCEQLLRSNAGGVDREQALRYLMSNFEPKGTIEIAYRADTTRPEG